MWNLTWSNECVLYNVAAQATRFTITDTKLYVLFFTLSTQDNAKLLQQLKSGFKRTITGIIINQKYQPKSQNNI